MLAGQTFFALLVRLSAFVVRGVLLVSSKVFGFLVYVFFKVLPRWVVKPPKDICFIDLKLTPSSYLFFFNLFACRMTIGHEEVSTSQVGRIRGTP